MFKFAFSNESKAQACLDANQQRRVKHVRASHSCMKDLNTAVHEAARCHERYINALDKVINTIALHSDTYEDAREQLGDCGAVITPTHPAAQQLCNAFNAWKASEELNALRKELESLSQLTDSGKQDTKRCKTNVEELEKYAIRCAAVNTPEHSAKIAQRSGKAREKLVEEQRELNAKLAQLDATLYHDIQTTGSWWSAKLVSHCDATYAAFSNLGQRTVAAFPQASVLNRPSLSKSATSAPSSACTAAPLPPPHSLPSPTAAASPPVSSSGSNTNAQPPTAYTGYAYGVPVDGQLSGDANTTPGGYSNPNAAAGVPLEFQTSRANAEHGKTLE